MATPYNAQLNQWVPVVFQGENVIINAPSTPQYGHWFGIRAVQPGTSAFTLTLDGNGNLVEDHEGNLQPSATINVGLFGVTFHYFPAWGDGQNEKQAAWRITSEYYSNSMTWWKDYTPGVIYPSYACVRDGAWSMVSNKQTQERPAPQGSGDPYWVSGLGDTPTWDSQQVSAGSIVSGQRYTVRSGRGIFSRIIRYWIPSVATDRRYSLWLVDNPTTNPRYRQLVGSYQATNLGWNEFVLGNEPSVQGRQFDIALVVQAVTILRQGSATWEAENKDGNPDPEKMWHQDNLAEMRFHSTPQSGDASFLSDVQVGGQISGNGQVWDILDIGSWGGGPTGYIFYVQPAYRLSEDDRTYSFEWYDAGDLDYVRVLNHYSGGGSDPNLSVQGMYNADGYDPINIGLDDNAYGIDMEIQNAVVSPDWDLLAYNG